MDDRNAQDRTLRDLLAVLFRHRRKAMATFFVALVAVSAFTFLTPDVYESTTKLLVRPGRQQLTLDPTVTTGAQVVSVTQSREAQLNSELEILRSEEISRRVIDALGAEQFVEASGEDPEVVAARAVESFEKALHLEVIHDTSIITVSYRARSPEFARQVVEHLIDVYLEQHIAAHRTAGSLEFFTRETENLGGNLETMEARLRDLRNTMNVGTLGEQRGILMVRIGQLESEIPATLADLSASRAKVSAMRGTLTDLPETLVTQETSGYQNSAAGQMRAKLYELQLREQDLLSRYREASDPVKEIRRQISEAEALLEKEQRNMTQVTRGLSAAHQQVKGALLSEEATLSALEARAQSLQAELENARGELRRLNEYEVLVAQLEREREISAANYRKYAESREQARIDQALELQRISNISVVQPPSQSPDPVSPNRPLNLAIGLLLGCAGAVAVTVLGELMDNSLRTAHDVREYLHAEPLLVIPRLGTTEMGRLSSGAPRPSRSLPGGSALPAMRAQEEGLVQARIGEYGESLREGLMVPRNGGQLGQPRILAVAGCAGGEGVSSIAASIANTLSLEGAGRVLLIDTKAIYRSREDGRFILPAHAIHSIGESATPQRPFAWKGIDDLQALLRREGSFVVLDCPPVLTSPAAIRLCRIADSVVLVVESERTRRQIAREARARLKQARVNLRGVVLNKKQFHVPEWLYRRL